MYFKISGVYLFSRFEKRSIEGLEYTLRGTETQYTINMVIPYVNVWLVEDLYVNWFLFPN